ncbi:MAG: hypothetical protein ACOC1M_03845 [Halanaerobium sp.]
MEKMFKRAGKKFYYYMARFTIVHVLTYMFIGVVFANLQNYKAAFMSIEQFENYRTLNSAVVRAAPFFQIFRGGFFAAVLYPFYNIIIKSEFGWLKLFFVIWGFSFIGSIGPIPGSIEGFIYTNTGIQEHLVGAPEVTIQALIFSWFFVKWENRTERDYA